MAAAPAPPKPAPPAPAPKPPETKLARQAASGATAKTGSVQRAASGGDAARRTLARAASGPAPAGLAVSHPADPAEREAVSIAARVMRSAVPGAAEGGELAPMRPRESLVPPVSRAEEAAEGPSGDGRLAADPGLMDDLGPGLPLDPATAEFFEARFGADLSHVRLHVGGAADRAARHVQARAFTLGHDIGFASGAYQPDAAAGRELIAHELVHVLQGGDGITRQVMRDGPAPTGKGDSDEIMLATELDLPPNKSRHAHLYEARAKAKKLARPKSYDRDEANPNQVPKWNAAIDFTEDDVRKAGNLGAGGDIGKIHLNVVGAGKGKPQAMSYLSDLVDPSNILAGLKIPLWDKKGNYLTEEDRFQVDHIVELQLGGADEFANFELFRGANNTSVGSTIKSRITKAIRADLEASAKKPTVSADFKKRYPPTKTGIDNLKADKEVRFPGVTSSNSDSKNAKRKEAAGAFWTKDEIKQLVHVSSLLDKPDLNADGTDRKLALYSPTGQLRIGSLPHGGVKKGKASAKVSGTNQTLVSGLNLESWEVSYDDASKGPGGSLTATWDLSSKVFDPGTVPTGKITIPLLGVEGKKHASALAWPGGKIDAQVKAASPIAVDGIEIGRDRLSGKGMITPSLPFLDGVQLPARLEGRGLRLSHRVDATAVVQKLKLPGIQVTEAGLTLYVEADDVGAEGFAAFQVQGMGEGMLEAGLSAKGKFMLSGSFLFDPGLFDQASVQMRYSEEGLSVSGTIGITKPGKIRGLKSASATVSYDSGRGLTVEGTAVPEIPGISSANLRYANGPEGQRIEGTAVLDKMPGIQGGTIGLRLRQVDGSWKLAAEGTVTPDIPGVTSQLQASYDDGAFTLGGTAAFAKGPFSGQVEVGATNRPLDPDGKILDGPAGDEIRAFGSGAVTARLSDRLQGKVGIKRRPNGQLLLSGAIGIPQSVELFGRHPEPPWTKTLLNLPTVNIPIFGGGIGSFTIGIGATIGGALTATAHVGPGMLENAQIGITDFDPTDMSSLQVTGHALFAVPAYAGLKLGIDAGITGGAAIISVTGGMNIGAELGVQARAAAEADLLWTPSEGLSLQATLNASAEPRLKFSVGAFAKADVSLLFTSFTVYRKDWKLADFEYGPALRIGLTAPIAWATGTGVAFDFDAIQFQLPSISPREMIMGLLGSQGTEQRDEG